MGGMRLRYVGPEEIRRAAASETVGHPIESVADLQAWWTAVGHDDPDSIATYVVTVDGVLRLAPRRSEHIACAGGGDVLAAGEIAFAARGGALVVELVVELVTNQSTGYCPPVDSWSAVASALDAIGVSRPPTWTAAFEFRRCPRCAERNLVKDEWWECAMCGAALPREWNF